MSTYMRAVVYIFKYHFLKVLLHQLFLPQWGHLRRLRCNVCIPKTYADNVGTNFSPHLSHTNISVLTATRRITAISEATKINVMPIISSLTHKGRGNSAAMNIRATQHIITNMHETVEITIFLRGLVLSHSETMFSSAFSKYHCSFSRSPDNSSFTVISRILHKGSIRLTSGKPLPVSHFDTVFSEIFSFSASSRWVKDFSFLAVFINLPVSI